MSNSNCVRSAGNCSVDRLPTAGQAVVLLGISTRRKATQELPRQLIHSSRFHSSFQP